MDWTTRSSTVRWAPHAKRTIQHMRVHHRRPHIRMPEQFLHGSNVVPRLQQVRGKRVPECVTAHSRHEPRASGRPHDLSLNDRFVQVISRRRTVPRIAAETLAGNANCHAHSDAAFGYLRSSGPADDPTESLRQIAFMLPAHLTEMCTQRLHHALGQHGQSILLSFAPADDDLPPNRIALDAWFCVDALTF
jgi:hypothetical protein